MSYPPEWRAGATCAWSRGTFARLGWLAGQAACPPCMRCRAMARQSAAAEERAERLAEENAALQQELALRPTPEQYASLQRQVRTAVPAA